MKNLYLIGTLPLWLVAGVALAAAALVIWQFLNLKQRLSLGQSWFLTLLRAAVYALLLFFLLGPALIDKRVTKLRRPLTVLIDSSQSMAFPASTKANADGKPGPSRLDAVRAKLTEGQDPMIQRLSRDYDLRLFRFGAGLEPMAPNALGQLKAQDQGSRIMEILQSATKDANAQSAILLFSDGIANGNKKDLSGTSLPVPVFAIGAGESEGFTDLRIAALHAPEFAFRGREFKLDVVVQAFGFKGRSAPLNFYRGKNLIASRNLTIDAEPFEQKITLSFTPKEIGTQGFSVEIPAQPGELIAQNNQKEFKVDVQRDKIRVLTLSGAPAWNYRFLRMAMKQDPLIELVSFVFLRTPTDSVDVPENRLSLIPFPIDDLFLEELKNFDVIVFDDFSHRAYFNPAYLDRVRDYVRDGGALAMFGGPRSFDSGGYGDSSLRDVLPVELDGKGNYQTQRAGRAALTAAGKAHPLTRLLPDPRANEEAWSKMPALNGYNPVRGARGEVLLTTGADGAPLLAVGRYGKGRTLAFMSDDAWRWNFLAVGNRETPQHHLKLIRQAVRWLAQEPSFEQVQLRPIGTAQPGEKTPIKLRVLRDDFTPTREASVQLRVFGPEGEPALLSATADQEEGEYSAEYTPTREGTYRVEAEATFAGKTLGKDKTSFSVAFAYGETDDGRPRPDLLKKVAEASKGEFIPLSQWNDKTLDRIAAQLDRIAPAEIVEQRQTQLWSSLWPFGIILGLLSLEWWMRRKWGLI